MPDLVQCVYGKPQQLPFGSQLRGSDHHDGCHDGHGRIRESVRHDRRDPGMD